MFKFFRKLRQRLLTENNVRKYMIYAIGEIVLVVIGILIALQINNWNEARKLDLQRQIYLTNLQTEFQYNLLEMDRVIETTDSSVASYKHLLRYFGTHAIEIDEVTLGQLIARSVMAELQFRPSSGALVQILNSGNLGIFHNEELKQLLASWDGALLKVRSQEQEHAVFRNRMLEIVNQKGNFRDPVFEMWGERFGLQPSTLAASNLPFLQSSEFENLTLSCFGTAAVLSESYYAELHDRILDILRVVASEKK